MEFRCFTGLLTLTKMNHSYRYYSRNVGHRKFVKILNSPEISMASIDHNGIHPTKLKKQNGNFRNKLSLGEGTTLFNYETISDTDSRFMKTLSLIQRRKLRERKNKIIIDGKRLIQDAINAKMKFHSLYFCHEEDLKEINFRAQHDADCSESLKSEPVLFKISSRSMKLLSSSSGIIGVCERPTSNSRMCFTEPVLPVTILCDNIRDPGNLGSIIKYAAVTGCQNVLLMKGCADPWETKVLKVGYGGHFHVPIINNIEWTNISKYIYEDTKLFIADNSSDIEHWEETPELINYDTGPRVIEDISLETETECLSINEHDHMLQANKYNELEPVESINLPCYLYSSVKYPKEKIVLYVGGETHGVDNRVEKLACNYGGKKVKIPLENGMDSLNSSYAIAIILYEIKRQLSEKLAIK